MTDDLTLCYSPGACSRVPMIQLETAGAAYALKRVDTQTGETRTEAFRRLNPKGKVPVLIEGSGDAARAITENVAIAFHLAQRFPQARLLPAEPRALTEALSLLSWCASGLHPLIGRVRVPQRVCDMAQAQPRIKAMALDELAGQLGVAEARLAQQPWLLGDDWCAADAYLFWVVSRALDAGFDLAPLPRVADHQARMRERPAVQRALAREAADAPAA